MIPSPATRLGRERVVPQILGAARNVVMNGAMEVAQRGTTFSTPAALALTLDRWKVYYDGTIGAFTVSQGAFGLGLPSKRERKNFLRWNHTSVGSGSTVREFFQAIEGVKTLAGMPCVLSLWASADAARTIQPALQQSFGTGGSPSSLLTFGSRVLNVGPIAQRYTANFVLPDLTGKTLGSNGDDALFLALQLPVASTFQIDIWDVQLEPGYFATEFEREPFVETLAKCQRFYEKSFAYATAPAQNAGVAGAHTGAQVTAGAVATTLPGVKFATRKRAAPTITLFNPSAANAFVRNVTQPSDFSVSTATQISESGFGITGTPAASSTAGQQCAVHWTADADL